MLAPVARSGQLGDDDGDDTIELSLTHNPRWVSLVYLDYVGMAIRPLRLQIEQNTTARLMRMAASLLRVQAKVPLRRRSDPSHLDGAPDGAR